MATTFYTVTESFVGSLGGHEVEYHKGQVVTSDDPAVKKMPLHFEALVVSDNSGQRRGDVEQATAAPGEKRGKAMTLHPEDDDVEQATAAPGEKR